MSAELSLKKVDQAKGSQGKLTTVVVRTNNDIRVIRETLDAIFAQQVDRPVENLLVDEGSSDGTLEIAKEYPFDERIELKEFRCGSYTLNRAYERARGDVIINCVGHAVPSGRDSFQILLDAMASPTVGAAYGRQVPHARGNPFRNVDFLIGYDGQRRERNILSLAFSILRRQLWEETPFNEDFGEAEDKAWARQIRQKGFKIIYEPATSVRHCDTLNWGWYGMKHWREAKDGKRLGISKRLHYLSVPGQVLYDWRYLSDKRFILVSPFFRTWSSLAYFAGWYLP